MGVEKSEFVARQRAGKKERRENKLLIIESALALENISLGNTRAFCFVHDRATSNFKLKNTMPLVGDRWHLSLRENILLYELLRESLQIPQHETGDVRMSLEFAMLIDNAQVTESGSQGKLSIFIPSLMQTVGSAFLLLYLTT
jgi:hypothetical protein